jgi:hypothetical protein
MNSNRVSDPARALARLTDPTHPEYDAEFTAALYYARPDWFEAEPDDTMH